MIQIYILLVSFFLQQPARSTEPVSLSIHISNIKSASSPVRIALYTNSEKFPSANDYFLAKIFIPGKTGDAVFKIDGIMPGDYALAVFQDLDNNSKLNTNFFGYPKEPFCFSNNIKPFFSAPGFKECRIAVSKTQSDIFLKLID
ncbi:MAG: DUF2141 domain-containing protein [Ferruginibacter sp.]